MLKYTIKRVLTFIPMLIAISLIAFIISINAPGDPVERLSKAAGNEGSAEQQSSASKKIKQELRKKLGLDLPIFYVSITDLASSDTLYKIQDKYHKANLEELNTNIKSELLTIPAMDVSIDGKKSPLMNAMSRTTNSLYECFYGSSRKILYPEFG